MRALVAGWSSYALADVSAAPLAFFRMIFGALMVFSAVRFMSLGWIHEQYIQPTVHFGYQGFEWVTSVGDPWMYVVFAGLTISAIGIMLGAWYRVSSVAFFLLFTYVELIDKTYYLNHYYFVSIVAAHLCVLPANSLFSIDSLRRPSKLRLTVPRWTIDTIKIQICLVYFFAGIAKINPDWLFNAMPLKIWLPAHADMPLLGWAFGLPLTPWIFSWMGMLFDVLTPFVLWNSKLRPLAYVAVVSFHAITGLLFQIGVFPLVMIGATIIFFNPGSKLVLDGMQMHKPQSPLPTIYRFVRPALLFFFVIQILLPFRYLAYPGNLFWTEEGYRFSWRVMLMEKSGAANFTVQDGEAGRKGYVNNREFLNAHQEKQMSTQPDMILQFAHWLATHYKQTGMTDPIVKADVWVTLNGAPSRQLVDSSVNLSKQELGFAAYSWIKHHE